MSSLWTPEGEHRVPRSGAGSSPTPPSTPPRPTTEAPTQAGHLDEASHLDEHGALDAPTPEELAAFESELAEARARVAQTPAELVVVNHAMGLYELGAIHLSNSPPNLPAAALAIDALGALVEGLAGRLGENEPVLRDALHQIRLAFVQVRNAS